MSEKYSSVNKLEAQGKLHVEVLKGRDTDLGSSGGFCVLILGKQQFKTKGSQATSPRDPSPFWKESFTFVVDNPLDKLEIEVRANRSNTLAGVVEIPLIDICDQKSHEKWAPMKKREKEKEETKGELQVKVQYRYHPDQGLDKVYNSITALREKNYTVASRLLDECVPKFPELWALYSYRSEARIQLGRFKEAMEDAIKVLELNPNSAEGYFRVGSICFLLEEYEKAEENYKLGLKYDPNHVRCKEALLSLQENKLKQQIKKSIFRGRQAFGKLEYDLAVSYFTDAIEKNPKNPTYYVYRAITNLAAKKDKEALRDALLIAQCNPNWPKDLKENGVILLGEYKLGKAEKLFFRIETPDRRWELKAETEEERNEWIDRLEKLLNKKPRFQLPKSDEQEEAMIYAAEVAKKDVNALEWMFNAAKTVTTTVGHTVFDTVTMPVKATVDLVEKVKNKLNPVTLKNPEYEGYLFKTGKLNKGWKKRYFALVDKILYYFHVTPEEFQKALSSGSSLAPNGLIALDGCKIESAQVETQKEFAFKIISPSRTFFLSAITETDMEAWKKFLNIAVGNFEVQEANHNPRLSIQISQEETTVPEPQNDRTRSSRKLQAQSIDEDFKKQAEQKRIQEEERRQAEERQKRQEEEKREFEESTSESLEDHISSGTSKKQNRSGARYFEKWGLEPPSPSPSFNSNSTEVFDDPKETEALMTHYRNDGIASPKASTKSLPKPATATETKKGCCCIV